MPRKLLVIVGPTAVGKTDYAIARALEVGSPVISCDSRQIFREMSIGTAVPNASQLAATKHYFIQCRSVTESYTAGQYEVEALALIEKLFAEGHETLVMAGGSGFYVEAVCSGLDDIPPADEDLRKSLNERLRTEGVESLRMDLRRLDPEAYDSMDIANPKKVLRAVEVCLLSGRRFSSYKLAGPKKRDFEIEKTGLFRPMPEVYNRINARVLKMMEAGLEAEVRSLTAYRELPALQTVGYKEIFAMMDGKIPREEAIRQIQANTRHYARKQMTWWRRDTSVRWVNLSV